MEVSCHCGNIRLKAKYIPEEIAECNCSICSRYSALWAYYSPSEVIVSYEKEESIFYIWGDKEVEFHRCNLCGCITHYITTPKCDIKRVGINMRMADIEAIKDIKIRKIDGASY